MSSLNSKKLQILLIAILTVLAYVNILGNGFVIDDKTFIVDWQTKNSFANVGKLLAGNVPVGHEGVYRPIRSLLYAVDWKIFGANLIGYHLQAILIHITSTALVYLIAEQIISHMSLRAKRSNLRKGEEIASSMTPRNDKMGWFPFVTALLFGLHPIHTETITYIASSMESVGLVFYFAAFYLYIRKMLKWSVVLAILAFFSTEITLTLSLVLVLYEVCFHSLSFPPFVRHSRESGNPLRVNSRESSNSSGSSIRSRMTNEKITSSSSTRLVMTWSLGPFFALAIIYVAIRFFVVHAGARGPYLADSVYLTLLTMSKVFVRYLSLLVWPVNLVNNHIISPGIEAFVYRDYRTAAISAQSILDPAILASLGILGILLILGVYFLRRAPIVSFGIFWFFATLLPVSEIVPQGSVMNEKFLYLPSFGFCLVVAYLLVQSSKFKVQSFGKTILLISGFIAVLYGWRTVVRNADWHDNVKLWSKDVAVYPADNAYAYFQLGNAYADIGAVDTAVKNYRKSFEINPQFVVAVGSIAKTYATAGSIDSAIGVYHQALAFNPNFWEAHYQLANIYTKRADFDLAKQEYRQVLGILPNLAQAQENLAALPDLVEATQSGIVASDNIWLSYHNIGGLSFKMPASWHLINSGKIVEISDGKGEFHAKVKVGKDRAIGVDVSSGDSPMMPIFNIVLASVKVGIRD